MREALIQRQRELVKMIEDQISGIEGLQGLGAENSTKLLAASRGRLAKAKEQLAHLLLK